MLAGFGASMPEFCSSCKAPIRWAITEAGNLMPLDAEPNPRGEWRLAPHDRDELPARSTSRRIAGRSCNAN